MKKIIKRAARLTPLALALAMLCSNPVKDVKWRTSVDLPITAQKKFVLGAMMDSLFFNHKQVLTTETRDTLKRAGKPDSIFVSHIDTTMKILKAYPALDTIKRAGKPDSIAVRPDTVAFGFPTHDTASDTISQDSMADKYFEDAFGPIPLTGAPNDTVNLPLAGPFAANTPVTTPTVPLTIKWVYHVVLKDTAQTLNVTIINHSSATFSTVQITLGTLGTATISNLAPNASGVAQFDARGKVIDSVINVSMTVTPTTAGAFVAGTDFLTAIFSPNGLVADLVVVNDNLLGNYKKTFTNNYNLTDTVDVDYIDIDKGFFHYSVTNNSNLTMLLAVVHRHLWRSDFCQGHNPPLVSISDLVNLTKSDTDNASNCNVVTDERIRPHQTDTTAGQQHNISANRLFTEWDTATKKSVTKIDYLVSIDTNGKPVTLSASDSVKFKIRATSFKFKEMYGKSMEQYKRVSAPSVIPVTLPWTKSVTDSLRGNFRLEKVIAMANTRIDIPQGAFIDTIMLHYVLSSVTHPGVACSSDVQLLHVSRDSLYVRPIDITQVVNDYPDSVKVNISLTIPVQTRLKAVNDLIDPTDPNYSKFIGRMNIKGIVDYNLVAPLWWTVVDTTIMDLGGATIDLSPGSGVVDPIHNMTDKHGSLNMQVTNNTNVYLRLFALAATDSAKVSPLVDTINPAYIKTNQFTGIINSANTTPGYVNLLGNGLLIPPRNPGSTVLDTITLTDDNLTQLLGAKKIGLRWQVRFIPHSVTATAPVPDALSNTDWIKLNSWIHIDGINSVDGLLK